MRRFAHLRLLLMRLASIHLTLISLLLLGSSACESGLRQDQIIDFSDGWEFAQSDSLIWRSARLPGSVQQDLILHGLLKDPRLDTAEYAAQWIEDVDWIYRKTFSKDELPQHTFRELVFDGLDTYCRIELNGEQIAESYNMFVPLRIRLVPEDLQAENTLTLRFLSTMVEGERRRGDRSHGLTAGNDSRPPMLSPYVRKAAYHFGWDWAPRVLTTGVWRGVSIEASDKMVVPDHLARTTSPYAHHFGEVALVREQDSIGTSFYFTVDGRTKFIRGANYVPQSMFPSEVSEADYRRLLTQVKASRIEMLRVWGGGIYERDLFYELCDSLGIMVWQDFMYAGAMYPADSVFLASARAEAEAQVRRLAHHPCIVLWCGNNEVDVAWQNWGWQQLMAQDSSAMQADYDRLFKHSLAATVPDSVDYIHTSPLSNWGSADNFDHHNMHYWGVWHGADDFSGFETNVPRFMSEYGFQSFPMPETFDVQLGQKHLKLDDPLMAHRQKSYKGTGELSRHMAMHFVVPEDFERYCYVSQLTQAYAMEKAINAHRFSEGHCMGTMYWQLNDVWAAPSWSTIDHNGNWKAAHYAVQDRYRDVVVASRERDHQLDLMVVNHSDDPFIGQLEVINARIDLPFGDETALSTRDTIIEITLGINEQWTLSDYLKGAQNSALALAPDRDYIRLRLVDENGGEVNEWIHFFSAPKDLALTELNSESISIASLGDGRYEIRSETFVKDLFVSSPDVRGEVWTDNFFDLHANEPKVIRLLTPHEIGMELEVMGLNVEK